jgi:hypothetical protein
MSMTTEIRTIYSLATSTKLFGCYWHISVDTLADVDWLFLMTRYVYGIAS